LIDLKPGLAPGLFCCVAPLHGWLTSFLIHLIRDLRAGFGPERSRLPERLSISLILGGLMEEPDA